MGVSYCTVQDMKDYGLPADGWAAGSALEELTDEQIQGFLDMAQGKIDSYLAARYSLPLVSPFPDVLRRCNIDLARCDIFLYRGFNPEVYDSTYKEKCQAWMDWLQEVADGTAHVPGIEDQTPDVNEGAPRVITQDLRGW